LLIVCMCLVVSCRRGGERPNLVLIGIDTLRRDHLGCYGYERATSPNIDRLAGEGVLFEDVVSQAPWTLPSFATVFTSLYPTQHGAGITVAGAGHFGQSMRTSFPPLAMILLKHGYSTGAIINGPALSPEYGLDRGFESYEGTPGWKQRPADSVTREALKWIDAHRDEPFFTFVHYFDPHVPYSPPAPYDTLFDPSYKGRVGKGFDRDTYALARQALSLSGDPRAEADWRHLGALYDGEIAFTDEAVGQLLQGLANRGLRQNTLVVLLSDHGEEFFDHSGFEHGHTLFDELIKVPLVFSLPGVVPENRRVARQARLVDVLPTVLDIMGVRPETHFEGTSLRPLISGDENTDDVKQALLSQPFAYSESILYGTEKKSVTVYPWKLIYDTVTGEQMLYNLKHDPCEQRNAVATDPETRRVLEEVLLRTLCGISETWYVELAGEGHVFDVAMTLPSKPVAGKFEIARVFDEDGHLVDPKALKFHRTQAQSEHGLMLQGLKIDGKLTVALKIAPESALLGFGITIDGATAPERTYLGESLTNPAALPFTQTEGRRSLSRGEPVTRPAPPYAVIWCSENGQRVDTPVHLADDTKRRLKALGYIH
jgi:arylsulfatase A-like enzyme